MSKNSISELKVFDAAAYLDSEEMIRMFEEASNEWNDHEKPPEGEELERYLAGVQQIVARARERLKDKKDK